VNVIIRRKNILLILLITLVSIVEPRSEDTNHMRMVDSLLLVLNNNFNINISSVDSISHEVMRTAKLLKNDSLIAELHFIIGQRLHSRGEYPKSYNNFMQALQIFERKNDFYNTAKVYRMLGESNRATNNFELATKFLDKSIEIFLKLNDSTMLASTYNRKAAVYYEYFKIDSMLKYIRLSNDMIDTSSSNIRIMSNNFNILGAYYMREGSFNEALHNYRKAENILSKIDSDDDRSNLLINMSILYTRLGQYEKAVEIALIAYRNALESGISAYLIGSSDALSVSYERLGKYDSAYFYKNICMHKKEEILGAKNTQHLLNVQKDYEEKQRKKQSIAEEQITFYKLTALIAIATLLLIVIIILYHRQIELKRKKNDLETKNRIINEQKLELSELNANKDLLFSIIAHDLKNPISSMQSIASLFVDEYFSLSHKEKNEFLNDIIFSAKSANHLLDSLHLWSRSQRNLIDLFPETFNLHELVEDTYSILITQIRNKNQNFDNTIPVHVQFSSDVNMVSTILRNLISNAIKFTHENGKIVVSIDYEDEDTIVIRVTDNGTGMNETTIKNLFKPGLRNTVPGTNNELGSGLGLMICSDFCKKLNGNIRAESVLGQGSSFIVTIPKIKNIETD